jgi:hypothetical protein
MAKNDKSRTPAGGKGGSQIDNPPKKNTSKDCSSGKGKGGVPPEMEPGKDSGKKKK